MTVRVRNRKRKRTFSLMFEILSLISFAGSLIFFTFAFAFTRCESTLSSDAQNRCSTQSECWPKGEEQDK